MECNNCKKIFKTNSRYSSHIEKCNISLKCIICSKELSCKSAYTRHINNCKQDINKLFQKEQETKLKELTHEFKLKEQEYKMKIDSLEKELHQKITHFENQIENERKLFNSQLKQRESDVHIHHMKKELKAKANKTNKTTNYNVIINNNFSGGISFEEIYNDFLNYYLKNPFIVSEKTFHKFLINSDHLKQNITVNDFARAITSYYDKDDNITVKDHNMKMISKKSINSINPELSDKMIQFTDNSDKDDFEKDKSKIFINNVILNKNTESTLFKEVEQKVYNQLKTILPNNVTLEKLHKILCTICDNMIITCALSSWQDIGYKLGKELSSHRVVLDPTGITVDNVFYRKMDFVQILAHIIFSLIDDNKKILIHLIYLQEFDKSRYTILKGDELKNWLDDKSNCTPDYIQNELFLGIDNAINYLI